jgi:hypothetical protein
MNIFDWANDEDAVLGTVLGNGVGAGSACWSNLEQAGVFDSVRASEIVQEMEAWILAHYELKKPPQTIFMYDRGMET